MKEELVYIVRGPDRGVFRRKKCGILNVFSGEKSNGRKQVEKKNDQETGSSVTIGKRGRIFCKNLPSRVRGSKVMRRGNSL